MMLSVPAEVIFEIANTVDAEERIGIRVDWIDRAIGERKKKKKSFAFAQQLQTFNDQVQ